MKTTFLRKQIYACSALLLMAVTVFGCGDDYDDTALKNDLNDLKSRVEKLESWCSTTNTQISALQGLVEAMEQNDCITGVTPIMEGSKEVGYTITFEKGKPITILHGRDGAAGATGITPIIGTKKDADGMYYWTIKLGDAPAEWMTDADGNKIRTTGDKGDKGDKGEDGRPGTSTDGHTPVLSVDTFEGRLYWKVDGEWLLHNNAKVPATGDKGDTGATGPSGPSGSQGPQGDAIFQKNGIDHTHPDYVVFTLADGTTTIKLPRVSEITIGIKGVTDEIFISPSGITVELQLPAADQYKAILAEITSKGGTGTDIATRAPSPWQAEILPGQNPEDATKLKITPDAGVTSGEKAVLKLSLIDKRNKEHQAIFMVSVSDYAWYLRGKSSGVYEITCAEELRMFAGLTMFNSEELAAIGETSPLDFAGETVKIADGVTEIDLGSQEWSPIGRIIISVPFQGTFDGNNAKIKNVNISSPNLDNGFFGEVKNATIKNVIVSSGTIKGNGFQAGIVGRSENSIIIHCVNRANVSANGSLAGGIVGFAFGGCIIACENHGKIVGKNGVGGIVGETRGVELLACINKETVLAASGTSGGIVGEFLEPKKYLAACLSNGEIEGNERGGIAGMMDEGIDLYEHNYFINSGQNLDAVYNKPELGQPGTLDEINKAIPDINNTIKQWNTAHPDTPCNYHYKKDPGNDLPTLEEGAP